MMWGYSGMTGWGYVFMALSAVMFVGLLVTVTVLAVRRTTTGSPTAEELLAQRFARGEIDAEKYHADQATLRGRHERPAGGTRPR